MSKTLENRLTEAAYQRALRIERLLDRLFNNPAPTVPQYDLEGQQTTNPPNG